MAINHSWAIFHKWTDDFKIYTTKKEEKSSSIAVLQISISCIYSDGGHLYCIWLSVKHPMNELL